MKRANHLIPKIADLNNLYTAFYKAQKGKKEKQEIIAYRAKLDYNLQVLQTQILNGQVVVGNYHYFTIYDPKQRIICAASFNERVLHHALMNVCHPVFEHFQIYDSYATRVGKGTYKALARAQMFHQKHQWFLKLDIRKYFDSINHQILQQQLKRRFKESKLLEIFSQIINSYQTAPNQGVPIGNLTSQYFANYYLAYTDRYIKQVLKIKAYVRYMDDMVIWHNDKKALLAIKEDIANFLLIKLALTLKIAFVNRCSHGLDFLGYRMYARPNKLKLNKRSQKRFKRKMIAYHWQLKNGFWTAKDYQRHVIPLLAFTQHANTTKLRQQMLLKIGE